MGKKKEPKLKRTALEVRKEIKDYIRNERDTMLLKWKCLEQTVHLEDMVFLFHHHYSIIILIIIRIIIILIGKREGCSNKNT